MAKISKSIISVFLVVFLGISDSVAQTAVLRGVVKLNELEGEPMVNVSVSADGAQPTVTESDGRFDLFFPNKRPGEVVDLSLMKDGYVVVHSIMLQSVLLADTNAPRIPILMAKEGDREAMAVKYFRLKSEEALQATYQQKLEELERQHEADATAITELKKELAESTATAGKVAEVLAQEKPGEKSPMYQEAMRLFLGGKVDGALAVLDEAKLQQRKGQTLHGVQELARDYQLKGQLLTLKFRFAEAADAYASAVETAPEDFDANFALGLFLEDLNHHVRALAAYRRSLEIARNLGDDAKVTKVLNNLGNLDVDRNRNAEARTEYEEALKIQRRLVKQNPDIDLLVDLATVLHNLGNLDRDQNRKAEARNEYEESLKIYQGLAEHNPDSFQPDVATTLESLGILDFKENRKDQARKAVEEALRIRRRLAEHDANTYLPDVATTLSDLGILDVYEGRKAAGRNDFEEALRIRRQLAEHNPDTYLPDVATSLWNLGELDWYENQKVDARKDFEEALKIFQQFAANDPGAYGKDVERVQRLLKRLNK